MKPKSPKLYDYGIQNEDSHIRAHVCPEVRRVYVYPTSQGIKALTKGRDALGYQSGVNGPTANGKLVKPFDIANCVSLQINDRAWDTIKFDDKDSTTKKGGKAIKLIVAMIKAGLSPLPAGLIVDQGRLSP
jgi:hypothetical protein